MTHIFKILFQEQIVSKLHIDLIILEDVYISILVDIFEKLVVIRFLE